jgi:hypothetical protein
MKIAVLNYSGNVGKTVISRHLLRPRMGPNCHWLPVESINEGGDAALNYRGREFKEVLTEIAAMPNVVVDIGSSNIEQVFIQLKKLGDSHDDFDFFVIPTVPAEKQQADTIKIVLDMIELGIETDKIKVVFNHVPDDADPQKVFGSLLEMLNSAGVNASPKATIHETELFGILEKDQTIADAISHDRDFKSELIAAGDDADKLRTIASERLASRMAKGVSKELDGVYSALFS